MIKQFSEIYFDYGWLLLTIVSGVSLDCVFTSNRLPINKKINIGIALSLVYIIIIAIAVYGKYRM